MTQDRAVEAVKTSSGWKRNDVTARALKVLVVDDSAVVRQTLTAIRDRK